MIKIARSRYGAWKLTGKSIGQGGQGQIHLVKNINYPDEVYALKQLLNLNRIVRFRDEVKASFKLKHPNIVNVIDYDCDNDHPFLVMNYYEKGSLDKIDLKSVSMAKKFEIFKKITEALAFAHENEPTVIHRDLKPENIFLNNDLEPIVGDFGICFFDDDGERMTLTDEAVGSIKYMAPELEEGRTDEISPASDVYSLGKILYWLIAGKIFAREKHRSTNYDITIDNPLTESYLINEFLDKMIVREPYKRFKNGSSVLEELNVLLRRINMGANCIGPEIPQKCIYCEKGSYKKVADEGPDKGYNVSRNDFGLQSSYNAIWIIFVCDHCANVQIFRPDLSDGGNRWE